MLAFKVFLETKVQIDCYAAVFYYSSHGQVGTIQDVTFYELLCNITLNIMK